MNRQHLAQETSTNRSKSKLAGSGFPFKWFVSGSVLLTLRREILWTTCAVRDLRTTAACLSDGSDRGTTSLIM